MYDFREIFSDESTGRGYEIFHLLLSITVLSGNCENFQVPPDPFCTGTAH